MSSDIPQYGPASRVVEYATSRPRVLGWLRGAAILDGDWGTSIAYVLGIAFALAGNSSFWHLAAMLILTTLVALNYVTICRLHPNGGGVYSTVYHRSRSFAVIGALLLGADYVITMSLSILDAGHYFGIQDPATAAMIIIFIVGAFNWFGPKHTGGAAIFVSVATLAAIVTIIAVSAPEALKNAIIEPPSGNSFDNWEIFVGIILSISGIEAVSNMTGLMKEPTRDSRRAILSVLTKVVVATIFLGLAMYAIPGLDRMEHKEEMVRFLGEFYVGQWFGWVVAVSIGLLLISAGNTALNGLISIQFLMSVDGELPAPLRKLNRHGVPIIPLIIATIVPIVVLVFIHDILTLAQLYAIGVVGAILINVGSTATDKSIVISKPIRLMMALSALVLLFVETSIAVDKPKATIFAGLVLVTGLGARALAQRAKVRVPAPVPVPAAAPPPRRRARRALPTSRFLVAMKDANERLLKFAIEESRHRNAFLFVLRVKEIAVGNLPERIFLESNGAERRIEELCATANVDYQYLQVPSYEVGYTIAEQAATFGVERVIIGAERRNRLENVLKGSVMRSLSGLLPEDVQLVIFGG